MSTQTTTRLATLPVVNLLPPEIGQQRRFRQLQVGLGAGVAASAAVVLMLYMSASHGVSSAQGDLDSAKAEGVSLQAETAKYSNVPAVIAKVDAAKAQRSQAMAQEIRWSTYLNDLSLRIPSKVWLTQLAVTQDVDGVNAASVAGTPGTTYPVPGIGQVTIEGQAYGHTDVARWLEMLAKEHGWTQAFFTNSTEDDSLTGPGGEPTVKFQSQATITDDALSRRFEQKAGN